MNITRKYGFSSEINTTDDIQGIGIFLYSQATQLTRILDKFQFGLDAINKSASIPYDSKRICLLGVARDASDQLALIGKDTAVFVDRVLGKFPEESALIRKIQNALRYNLNLAANILERHTRPLAA